MIRFNNLLQHMYSHYDEGTTDSIDDIWFQFDDEFDSEFFKSWDNLTVSDYKKKLKYLAGHYKYETFSDGYRFPKGCLRFLTMDGKLYFRDKSEWFRKLPTDILFAQQILGKQKLEIFIPKLWIRSQELPTFKIWAERNELKLLERHRQRADYLIEKYPLEEVIKNTHSITRRYFIRYYYLRGAMTYEQFKKHKSKTAKKMRERPELLTL